MKWLLLLCLLLFVVFANQEESDELVAEDEVEEDIDEETVQEIEQETPQEQEPSYNIPQSVDGSYFFENFQDSDSFKRKWVHSSVSEFVGKFKLGKGGDNPSISGEQGLFVPTAAQRYAIFGSLDKPFGFSTEESFVVQYEVRLHNELQCGGAYIKLLSQQPKGWTPSDVSNETPYTVMFGPDKCGSTNKVHFIWKFKNPNTNKYVEHHLKNPPSVPDTSDKKSHVYTLVIHSNNAFEVFIDKTSKVKGSLLEDFDPPLIPAEEIDDPEDTKPSDWVDNPKIPDPEASKPEDWDEDAPRMIVDPTASKPDGWLDDEPLQVADPGASQPEDWDEDDDGTWEAPIIDNPKCEAVGCGEWKAPEIENPEYKGKWRPPMVDNPDYSGEFKPKQIPNPDYFTEDAPFQKLNTVAGVGIDIWTMQKGIEYDNIYIGTNQDAAYALANSWEVRKQYQDRVMKSMYSDSTSDSPIVEFLKQNWQAVAVTGVILMLTMIYFCCCSSTAPEHVIRPEVIEEEIIDGPTPDPQPEPENEPVDETTEVQHKRDISDNKTEF